MAIDYKKVALGLMEKTVQNGCSAEEASAAASMLAVLIKKHGFDVDELRKANQRSRYRRPEAFYAREGGFDPFRDKTRQGDRPPKAEHHGSQDWAKARRRAEEYKKPPGPAPKKEWSYPEAPTFNVGLCVEWHIMNTDWPWEAVADEVRELILGAETSPKAVAWYASKLRKAGYEVPKRRRR